jgi:broad specificity phosphatase PhoE
VRHAEKVNDGSKDAELSEEGKQRAARLSQMLANQKISAVYSTNFKRTQNTVSQLAKEHGVGVTPYESLNGDQLKVLAAQYKGGTVVICGHSNTTPVMINAIRGTQEFKQWEDGDYGNLILVTVTSSGETSLTALRY